MSDIRKTCPLECIAKETDEYTCDKDTCLKHQAYDLGIKDGVAKVLDMLKGTHMTIDEIAEEVKKNGTV